MKSIEKDTTQIILNSLILLMACLVIDSVLPLFALISYIVYEILVYRERKRIMKIEEDPDYDEYAVRDNHGRK